MPSILLNPIGKRTPSTFPNLRLLALPQHSSVKVNFKLNTIAPNAWGYVELQVKCFSGGTYLGYVAAAYQRLYGIENDNRWVCRFTSLEPENYRYELWGRLRSKKAIDQLVQLDCAIASTLDIPLCSGGDGGGTYPLIGSLVLADRVFSEPFFEEGGVQYFAPAFGVKSQVILGVSGALGCDYADDRLERFISARGSVLVNPQGRAIVLSESDPGEHFGSDSEFLTANQIPPLPLGIPFAGYSMGAPSVAGSSYPYGTAALLLEGLLPLTVNSGGGTVPVSKIPPSQNFCFCWVI